MVNSMNNISHSEILMTKDGLYCFKVKARNGEVLFESEHYTNKNDAKESINRLMSALRSDDPKVIINFDDFRKPYITVVSDGNFNVSSSTYKNVDLAKKSFKKFADSIKDVSDINITESKGVENNINNDNRISSVVDFVTRVSKIEREKGYLYYFRGHSDYRYEMVPGIYRKEKRWITHEHRLFREIMLKCPSDFKGNNTTFQNLVKMQHYALPTRLLDITSNALIALYFSCVGEREKLQDGEVIIFKVSGTEVKYFDDPEVSLLSNLSKQDYLFKIRKRERISNSVDTYLDLASRDRIKMIMDAVQRDGCYMGEEIDSDDFKKVLCVKPEMDNPRIIRQDGAFLLFGMDEEKKMPSTLPDSYLYNDVYGRLIIKAEEKDKIISELESLGISASGVYPEIEHVAGHIKIKYS